MSFKPDWRMHFANIQQPGNYEIAGHYFDLLKSNVLQAMTKDAISNNVTIFDASITLSVLVTIDDFTEALKKNGEPVRTIYWNDQDGFFVDLVGDTTVVFYSRHTPYWYCRVLSYSLEATKMFLHLKGSAGVVDK
jgi:hypothetical protein